MSYDFGALAQWQPIDPLSKDSYDVIPEAVLRFTQLMENMTPEKLGQISPYVRIHEINDDGSLGRKISTDLYQPPQFGRPLDFKFSERPDVSLENVRVKTVMPRGWILYRELDMAITVHRPDAVFRAASGSLMQSLLDFTKSHVIIYGWSGQQTVLANGPPPESKDKWKVGSGQPSFRGVGTPSPNGVNGLRDQPPPDYRQVMPTKATIRFKVTNYNFTITPDMQVKFAIHAIEDGEIASRDAVMFNNRNILPLFDSSGLKLEDADVLFNKAIAYFNDQITQHTVTMPVYVTDDKTKQQVTQPQQFISLLDVFNIFFADPITFAARQLGYHDVRLHLGMFNDNCPKTTAAYGSKEYKGQSIADFMIPLKWVTDLMGQLKDNSVQMTAYGLIREVSNWVSNPEVWEYTDDTKMTPELVLRTRYNAEVKGGFALFQLMDRKYFVANSQLNIGVGDFSSKKALRKALAAKNIPFVSLMGKLSYIKDAKFEVINDEQMKSIFIRRAISKTRSEIATSDTRNAQLFGGLPGFAMMYRSAIKGTITVLGNFAFDAFGLLWMDFGIPAYDGLFYVLQKEDQVDSTGFYSSLTLQAEGSNPLGGVPGGTGLPKWVTGNGERSMADWIRSQILASQKSAQQTQRGLATFGR